MTIVHKRSNDFTYEEVKGLSDGEHVVKVNDVIIQKFTIVNGKEHGMTTGYYSNGNVKYIRNWKHGKPCGYAYAGHHNGAIKYMYEYDSEGKKHGTDYSCHPNGKLRHLAEWKHGKRVGTLRMWNEQEKLIKEQTYTSNGRPVKV